MQRPLLHPSSDSLLEAYLRALPQAFIITGAQGTGTLSVAKYVSHVLGSPEEVIVPKKKTKDGKKFEIDIENGRILTEDIRGLYDSVRGKQTTPRVFIIRRAERMMPNAQHALLKLLEEPNANVYFILETSSPEKLFTTVRSRAQTLTVLPITDDQTEQYLDALQVTDATKRAQLRFIAAGLPDDLQKLVSDETYFATRAQLMNDARQLLQPDRYQRLLIVQKYQPSRESALQLIDSVLQIARRNISLKPQHELVVLLDKLLVTKEQIASNHNVRLQLTQLAL